jgi:hypothetical protein
MECCGNDVILSVWSFYQFGILDEDNDCDELGDALWNKFDYVYWSYINYERSHSLLSRLHKS